MQEITLKKLRRLYRLTQEELGEKLGYKGGYISILESGQREFSDSFTMKLEEVFALEEKGLKLVRTLADQGESANPEFPMDSRNVIGRIQSEITMLAAELANTNSKIREIQGKLEEQREKRNLMRQGQADNRK
jgi:transcriptional regulator with XRE-family HTH domain